MSIEFTGNGGKCNQPCSCGSGLKFKRCHGDPQKLKIVKHVANEAMLIMIAYTKRKSENIDFSLDDYYRVINNSDFVLPNFVEQFLN